MTNILQFKERPKAPVFTVKAYGPTSLAFLDYETALDIEIEGSLDTLSTKAEVIQFKVEK